MAYTVAITNQKGGVGKTTTAVNLAAALAIAERRTLLVDADPQGNTTSGVGIAKVELQLSLYDALVEDHPVQDIILSVPGLPHLSLLPATQDLVGAELQLVERPFRESALRRVLEPIEGNYDYIIVDCPPSLGLLTLNVLAAVQALIIPIQCEYYGLEGISQLLNTVRLVQQNINPGLAIGGVLLTMYDSRLNLCRQVAEDATEYFGPKVFGTPIPRNVRLAEAPSFGKPILLYDMQSVGAKSYLAVGQELLRRVEGEHATGMPTGTGTGDHGRSTESSSDETDGNEATATETATEETTAAETVAAETPEPIAAEADTEADLPSSDGASAPTAPADQSERDGARPDGAGAQHAESSGESQVAPEPLGSTVESEPATSSDSPPPAGASDDHESARASRPSPEPLPGVTT
jgi:chromosome partitioning protein